MTETTEIATSIPEGTQLSEILEDRNKLEGLIKGLEQTARGEASKLSTDTKKGRDAMKSLAHKVSKSKVELDRRGKALTEDARKKIETVNAARNLTTNRLDALRDEIKAPALKWEETETARKDGLETRLCHLLDLGRADIMSTSEQIAAVIASIAETAIDDSWDEYRDRADVAKTAALEKYGRDLEAVKIREKQQAELNLLRAEAADRARKDAEAQAEQDRIAAEKEAAELAEQRRITAEKAEAERVERIRQEAKEKAERDLKEQQEQAEQQRIATENRHKRELEQAKLREERAAQVERDRIAAEKKTEDDARAKREADEAHRAKILSDIANALRTMSGKATPEAIAEALLSGKIPHTTVNL